jgi:hypothetical protein
MNNDQPTSEIPPSGGDRKRFEEEAGAAADYIAKNVRGRTVPDAKSQPVVELYSYVKERATNEDIPSAN